MKLLVKPLLFTSFGFLMACSQKADRGVAPFQADPAPETWTRPAKEQALGQPEKSKGDGLVHHLVGEDKWPCEGNPICQRKAPSDESFGVTVGGFETIDPSYISETEGMFIANQLFEGLISPARQSGGPLEQGVAYSWTASKDSSVWTFKLREDARWSNGRPVIADDFVFAWQRKLSPETGADGVDSLLYIKNAEAFNQGKIDDPALLGVKALDDHTLEVTLVCSIPYFPSYLVSAHYLPVPKEAVLAHGRKWTRPGNIVTNGAYELEVLKERDRLVMVKSQHYWDKENVKIPKVVAYHAETEPQSIALYEGGEALWARGAVSPNAVTAALSDKRPDFFIDPLLCIYYYIFRVDHPALQDPRVRRAISLAIDKERLVKHVTRGMQEAAYTLVPPSFSETMGYPEAKKEPYNPDLARRLMAEAGFSKGGDYPPLRLIYNTMESHQAIADYIGSQLQENLGIQVKVENMEWKSLLQELRTNNFQMARLGMCSTDTPISFLEQFKSESPRNNMGWKSEAFDEAFEKARCHSPTPKDYLENVSKAEAIALEGYSLIPLYWYTRPYYLAPVVGGMKPHIQDHRLIKYYYFRDVHKAPKAHPMPDPEILDNAE